MLRGNLTTLFSALTKVASNIRLHPYNSFFGIFNVSFGIRPEMQRHCRKTTLNHVRFDWNPFGISIPLFLGASRNILALPTINDEYRAIAQFRKA
jgi:hypothetical protein